MAIPRDLGGHWDSRYDSLGDTGVSWFQDTPVMSLGLLATVGITSERSIVDVGGGASRLVDVLVAEGFADLSVVDVSERALDLGRARLPSAAVRWVHADVRTWRPGRTFDVWHDRAAYHFLTEPDEQDAYWRLVRSVVPPGGYVIVGTFAEDGPESCSGLPVSRYSAEQLIRAMGSGFEVCSVQHETHMTPALAEQRFVWVAARRTATDRPELSP